MRGLWMLGAAMLAVCPIGAMAQDKDAQTIQVTGVGSVETPPDQATISYWVRGEGTTSDEAVRAMVAKKAAIDKALGGLGDVGLKSNTGNMQVSELRGAGCAITYDRAPQPSEGPCTVRGYSAQLSVNSRLTPAKAAGTVSGVAARAGASNVNVLGFSLGNAEPARHRALDAAIADGRAQAEAIARATGVKLGVLMRVTDPYSGGRPSLQSAGNAKSMARVETPVEVEIAPAPVSTNVSLVLTYKIER